MAYNFRLTSDGYSTFSANSATDSRYFIMNYDSPTYGNGPVALCASTEGCQVFWAKYNSASTSLKRLWVLSPVDYPVVKAIVNGTMLSLSSQRINNNLYMACVPLTVEEERATNSIIEFNSSYISSGFCVEYFKPPVELVSSPEGVVDYTLIDGMFYQTLWRYRIFVESNLYNGIAVSAISKDTESGLEYDVASTVSPTDFEISFTMPINGVRLSSTANKSSYSISYTLSDYGIASGLSSATWGNTVTVTVTPNIGYTVAGLTVRQGTDNVQVTRVSDTNFTFIMPVGNVIVTPSFNDILSVVWQVRPASMGSVRVAAISEYRKATDAPTSWTQIAGANNERVEIYTSSDVMWGLVGRVLYLASRSQFTVYEKIIISGTPYSSSVTADEVDATTGVNLYFLSLSLSSFSSITNLPLTFTSLELFIQAAANRVVNGIVGSFESGTTISFNVEPLASFRVTGISGNNGNLEISFDTDNNIGTFTMPEVDSDIIIYMGINGDPNQGGGISQVEVPNGSFDNESDTIIIPTYADRGVVNVTAGKGLITLWNPTNAEIADIGQYLYSTDWGDALYQGFRDFFVKPLESAISLHVVPITPARSANKQIIRFGPHNSGVSAYAVTNQYVTVDLGTLAVTPYWDSYLDYNPYTKIQIYLPYIGTQDIDADIVMGKTIGVRYKFDVLTGACVAFLYTIESSTPSIFAEFVGESAMQIPLCSSDYSRVIGGIIQAAATVVTGRMVSGAAMKASNELIASKQIELEAASNRLDSFKRKRPRTEDGKAAKLAGIEAATKEKSDAANGLAMAQAKAGRTQASMYAAELRAVPYEVGSVMGGKATTTISGSVAGGAGLLGSQVPYLLIRRPKQSLPENYNKYVGYPSNIYAILGSLTGYTRIEQADLEGIPCTDAELAMIYKALKEGVYL